jgi:hypothetical protein
LKFIALAGARATIDRGFGCPSNQRNKTMMESSTQLPAGFSQRCRILNAASHVVRQSATRSGGDFEGWRLSRLMREAETDAQVNFAERKYADWQQVN